MRKFGNRLLAQALLVSGMIGAGIVAGCSTAPIHNVETTRLSDSQPLEVREKQIDRAARLQNWEVETIGPGVMVATKRRGAHMAASTIRFSPQSYSITLRNSVELEQSKTRIHDLHHTWVQGLDSSIRQETAAGVSGPRPAE